MHVAGCAGASLERVEHGDVRGRSVGDASGRPDDGARPPAGEKAEARVRPRRRRLDVRVGADQRRVGRAPGELERLARALGEGAVERPRRDVLDAEAVALSADPRYAPNLVSRSALAMTSGIRWCDGRTPRLPAAHARSVKAVTGSAPQQRLQRSTGTGCQPCAASTDGVAWSPVTTRTAGVSARMAGAEESRRSRAATLAPKSPSSPALSVSL